MRPSIEEYVLSIAAPLVWYEAPAGLPEPARGRPPAWRRAPAARSDPPPPDRTWLPSRAASGIGGRRGHRTSTDVTAGLRQSALTASLAEPARSAGKVHSNELQDLATQQRNGYQQEYRCPATGTGVVKVLLGGGVLRNHGGGKRAPKGRGRPGLCTVSRRLRPPPSCGRGPSPSGGRMSVAQSSGE